MNDECTDRPKLNNARSSRSPETEWSPCCFAISETWSRVEMWYAVSEISTLHPIRTGEGWSYDYIEATESCAVDPRILHMFGIAFARLGTSCCARSETQ